MARKRSKSAPSEKQPSRSVNSRKLLNWHQLRAALKKGGLGEYGPNAHNRWLNETPPMPVVRIGRRGSPHLFDFNEVVAWLANRQAHARKGWTPPNGRNGSGHDPDSPEAILDPHEEKERWQAAREKLKYFVEVGNLIPRADLKVALDQAFANIRTRILIIPDKIAARVANVESAPKCRRMILDALTDALRVVSTEGVLTNVTSAANDDRPKK